jgi:hypothetical protein
MNGKVVLRQQGIAKGFGGDAGAVRDEENSSERSHLSTIACAGTGSQDPASSHHRPPGVA